MTELDALLVRARSGDDAALAEYQELHGHCLREKATQARRYAEAVRARRMVEQTLDAVTAQRDHAQAEVQRLRAQLEEATDA